MPAYDPNLLISDCYGSAGSITFYHRDGKCRWRSKSTLSFTATPGQSAARNTGYSSADKPFASLVLVRGTNDNT